MVLIFRLGERAPDILKEVLLEEGWEEFDEQIHAEHEWNLWWKTARFTPSQLKSCNQYQRINHFPYSSAMTKKDCMVRQLRMMKGSFGSIFNFFPESFLLPNEYTKFVKVYSEEQEQAKKSIWICKPTDLSRGRKIFLFRDLSDLSYDTPYVLQRYIENPLLIHGYKFDLRVYVLVTSFHPLRVHLYREGLARFGTEKYDPSSLENKFSHLTNASINKFSPLFETNKQGIGSGSKWTFTRLREYWRQNNIDDRGIWKRIENVIILTLISTASSIPPNCDQCFELYGFDIILDTEYKPWLLEVNFSPSLGTEESIDIEVKKPLLRDVIYLLKFVDYDKKQFELDRQKPPTKQRPTSAGLTTRRSSPAPSPTSTPPSATTSGSSKITKSSSGSNLLKQQQQQRQQQRSSNKPPKTIANSITTTTTTTDTTPDDDEEESTPPPPPHDNDANDHTFSLDRNNFDLIFPFNERTEAAALALCNNISSGSGSNRNNNNNNRTASTSPRVGLLLRSVTATNNNGKTHSGNNNNKNNNDSALKVLIAEVKNVELAAIKDVKKAVAALAATPQSVTLHAST